MVTGSHQIKYRRDEDETILRHIRIFKTIHVSISEILRKKYILRSIFMSLYRLNNAIEKYIRALSSELIQ